MEFNGVCDYCSRSLLPSGMTMCNECANLDEGFAKCGHEPIDCPSHNGAYDCTPFCKVCEGNQGYCAVCEPVVVSI
jgi:hypothetical protein